VGVGYAAAYPTAHYKVKDLTSIDIEWLLMRQRKVD